jgi:uncharacterized protein YjbJ (UPF0337 family)
MFNSQIGRRVKTGSKRRDEQWSRPPSSLGILFATYLGK